VRVCPDARTEAEAALLGRLHPALVRGVALERDRASLLTLTTADEFLGAAPDWVGPGRIVSGGDCCSRSSTAGVRFDGRAALERLRANAASGGWVLRRRLVRRAERERWRTPADATLRVAGGRSQASVVLAGSRLRRPSCGLRRRPGARARRSRPAHAPRARADRRPQSSATTPVPSRPRTSGRCLFRPARGGSRSKARSTPCIGPPAIGARTRGSTSPSSTATASWAPGRREPRVRALRARAQVPQRTGSSHFL
jgi:hypothetical protein